MKRIFLFLLVLFSINAYSQSVTFECYVNDTLKINDCTVCNLSGDVEIFTGIIVQAIKNSDTTRTKIFYPYGLKLRDNDILLFDNKAHQVFFKLDSTEFNNYDDLISWLKMCHFPDKQFVDSLFIDGDTLGVSISNSDIIKKVTLPPGFVDTDDQKVDTFYVDGDSIYIKIENDSRTWGAKLTPIIIGELTDTQKINLFYRNGDTIFIRIDGDTTRFLTLQDPEDIVDTDKQYFDSVSFSLDTFRFSLIRDSQDLWRIPFNKYLDNTDTQKVIQFRRSNDTLYIQVSNDIVRYLVLPKTDTQRINLFERSGDTIKIRIDNDTIRRLILPAYVDIDTDKQYFDSASLINDTLNLSLIRDSQSLWRFPLNRYLQYVDTFDIVGGLLRIGLKNDNMPLKTVNLSYYDPQFYYHFGEDFYTNTLSNGGGSFTLNTTNNISLYHDGIGNITLDVPFSVWRLNATNDAFNASIVNNLDSITLDGINGIRTQLIANGSRTMTIDGQRLQWYLSGNTGGTYLIGDYTAAETVNIVGTGIISTRTGFNGISSDSLIIFAYEKDSSITNEIQTIDTFIVKKTTKGDSIYLSLTLDNQPYKSVFINKHLDSTWFDNSSDTLYLRVRDTILKVKIPETVYTDNDNYVDTIYYSTNDTIIVGRTGSLPDLKIKITHPAITDNYVDSFYYGLNDTLIIGRNILPDLKVKVSSIDNYVDTALINSTYDTITIGRNILPDLKIRLYDRDSQTLSIVGTDSLKISRGNTIKLPISPDNYVDSVTFNTSNRILYLSRTNALSTLFDTIPDADTDKQYLDTAFILNNNLLLSIFGDGVNASSIPLSSYLNSYTHAGSNSYTNALVNGGANNTFTLLGSTGIILNHSNSVTTFRAADSSATNEIQHFSTVGLVHGLSQSSSTLTFASANANLTITQSGTAANSTLTFNVATPIDNYVDALSFVNGTRTLTVGRNILSDLTVVIPDADSQSLQLSPANVLSITRGNSVNLTQLIDHDWYNYRTKVPPTSITDTIYTKNLVGINDTTPDNELDVEGVFSLRNKQGVGETRIDMNWNTNTGSSTDYVYHIDYNRDATDIKDGTYQGYIDYHLHDALTMTTVTRGEMRFGINSGGNDVRNTLILYADTAITTRIRNKAQYYDKDANPGVLNSILQSTNTATKWNTLKAGAGITIVDSSLTITAKDTSFINEIQSITPYIVSGDTIGFLLSKINGLYDTVIIVSDTSGMSGGSGGGSTYTFTHAGTVDLTSTLNPSAGSIGIQPGTQISITPNISGINATAKINTNFNGCQTCVGYFGDNSGFTNDSVITNTLFKFYSDEGIYTLEAPTITLTQTNQYSNPVALYISQNNDERVYVSSIDASGFTSGNFYHKVNSNGVNIALPSGHTGATTHYIINDQGFSFTISRSGTETIDGLTSQSFSPSDKLVTIVNDGSGKWVTSKTGSSSSNNISYSIGPASPPQSISTTSLSDIQNSTSPSIPIGRYMVRINIKNNSWGDAEGYKLALSTASGSVTLNIGKWEVHTCSGTTVTLIQESMSTATTINSNVSCSTINMIEGLCDITVNSTATIKVQLSVETSSRATNIWSGTVELIKI